MRFGPKPKCRLIALILVQILAISFWSNGIRRDVQTESNTGKASRSNNMGMDVFRNHHQAASEQNMTDLAHKAFQNTTLDAKTPLRVYVYEDLPAQLTNNVEHCKLGKRVQGVFKKKSNFMADIPIINLFRTYPGRTWNPDEADLFVVPYPHKSHCMCNLKLPGPKKKGLHCPQVPDEDIDLLMSSLSLFNQTTMMRHLFILSGDYGWNNKRLEMMPLLLTLGPKPEGSKGRIVIPYMNDRDEYQPSVLRRRSGDWWTKPRKYAFSYFYGGEEARPIRGLFREEVEKNYGDEIGGYPYIMKKIQIWTPKEQDEVFETYRQSLFCPCLPGDNAPQKRFFDVAMSGCLPVVISFNQSRYPGRASWFRTNGPSVQASYPFASAFNGNLSTEIDYESFVVQVPESISNVKPTLESILSNPESIRQRQEKLRKYAPLFSYGKGDDAHKFDDAFSRILMDIRHYLDGLERDSGSGRTGIARNSLPNGPRTHPRPQLSNKLLDRFIVIPERKLLFCYVEKVGCSMFNHLFRMLRLILPEIAQDSEEVAFQANFTWWRNTPAHHGLNKSQLESMMVDPAWTKAVFYRDPVTRFLSAFRSKCEQGHDIPFHCKQVFGQRFVSFDDALTRIKHGAIPRNPHFLPASEFCGGLGSTIGYYDFVHELNSKTAPLHVEALLRKIGVQSEVARSLVNSIVRTGGTNVEDDKRMVSHLGVELGFGKTQKKTHTTGADKGVCEYYRTKEDVRLVAKLYSADYATFEIVPRELNCTF